MATSTCNPAFRRRVGNALDDHLLAHEWTAAPVFGDVLKWRVPLRMGCPLVGFPGAWYAVVEALEQLSHCAVTHERAPCRQSSWANRRVLLQVQCRGNIESPRVVGSTSASKAWSSIWSGARRAGRSGPMLTHTPGRVGGLGRVPQLLFAQPNRTGREPCLPCDRCRPTVSETEGLGRGPQTSTSCVQFGLEGLIRRVDQLFLGA